MKSRAALRRGRHDPWKVAFFGALAAALVVGVAWALLGSSFIVVRSVLTIGSPLPRAQILDVARIRLGTPLIRVNTGAVARRVEQLTQVQAAKVTRSWPDTIVIWTKQRTATFAVPEHPGYLLMDSYGVILGRASSAPAGLVVLRSPTVPAGQVPPNPAVLAAGTVVRNLPPWLRSQVSAVRAVGKSDVILILRGGASVVWGAPRRTAAKAAEVAILLRTKARSYDVSDPRVVVTGTGNPGGPAARPAKASG
jgi:cell division septal protein FtsQ